MNPDVTLANRSRSENRNVAAQGGPQRGDIIGGTPSPSDSGVGELEAMLKEREAEILTLRQVMDRNERAILQVNFPFPFPCLQSTLICNLIMCTLLIC